MSTSPRVVTIGFAPDEELECTGLNPGEDPVLTVDLDHLLIRFGRATAEDVAAALSPGRFLLPESDFKFGPVTVAVNTEIRRAFCPQYDKTDGRCKLYDPISVADGMVFVHPCKAGATLNPVKAVFKLIEIARLGV